MSGTVLDVVEPERLVATERFDESWYPGEAVATCTLAEHEAPTTLIEVVQYESRAARDVVLATPMEAGLESGFARLAALVETRGR